MRRTMLGIMVIFVALSLSGCLSAVKSYKKSPSLAQYDGEVSVPGLKSKVEVYRDQYGIPHIFADNDEDLFTAVGYVQAQDRLWEMIFMRAAAEGRLCELIGEVSLPGLGNTFAIDKHQRIFGLKWLGEVGEALIREKDPENYGWIQAYSNGVNAFIDSHREWEQLPVEFQVLRIKPDRWRVADVVSYGMLIGYQLGANMDDELVRYGLIKHYGEDLAWELFPLHYSPESVPYIVPREMLKNKLDNPRDLPQGGRPSEEETGYKLALSAQAAFALAAADRKVLDAFDQAAPMASNDWIVSGKLTESGHPILANDPHLEHAQPSLFYPMHLKSNDIDAYGVAFAGVPFPVLGHNRKLSWGATTPPADVQDLFMETTDKEHPGKYLYQGEWRPFTVRKDKIMVRMGSRLVPREIEIRQTIHGPIINDIAGDLPKGTPPMALRWTAWDFSRDPKVFEALIQSSSLEDFMPKVENIPQENLMSIATMYNELLRGGSIQDFIKAMGKLAVPVQNWVGADADGHIIYLPGGLIPVRKKGIGVMPVPGDTGEFDWSGFIPLMELPYAIDPERGYMATANNTVVEYKWYPYIFGTRHDEGWRAWRIEELIKELAPLSVEDMKRIQNDVQIKRAVWEVPIILAAVERKKPSDPLVIKAADELKNWDKEASLTATAVVVFFQFNREFRRNVLSDEVPAGDYEKYLDRGMFELPIIKGLDQGSSPLFDDKRTKDVVETMDDMIVKSLHDAMAAVDKTYGPDPKNREWGKLHTITWEHTLGIGPLKDMSVGPLPHTGANETIRCASFSGKGKKPWVALEGPVLRHIIDMGDPENAQLIIDGSVSGQWLSPHYRDMHELYNNSQYVTATMDREKAIKEAKDHLTLKP